jgi:hypothetical protein
VTGQKALVCSLICGIFKVRGAHQKEDTKDLLSLGNNLTFSQLSITQQNSATFFSLSANGEFFVSLNGVSSTLINVADFG